MLTVMGEVLKKFEERTLVNVDRILDLEPDKKQAKKLLEMMVKDGVLEKRKISRTPGIPMCYALTGRGLEIFKASGFKLN